MLGNYLYNGRILIAPHNLQSIIGGTIIHKDDLDVLIP